MRHFIKLALLAAIGSQLGATDCGQAIKDPGFDLWCGDTLCAWKVERGSIQEVDTWHAGDHGVSLVGDNTAIEQWSPVASTDGVCIEFDLIANIDANVDATLNVDVFGDGTVDASEHLPTGTWQPLAFQIMMPAIYQGVRFEIAKTGSGAAELANIGAQVVADGCAGQPPLVVTARPGGAVCGSDGDCAAGLFCGDDPFALTGAFSSQVDTCVPCDTTRGGCGSGDACGAGVPLSPVLVAPTACVADASKELGQLCAGSAECASGICYDAMCSTCASSANCTGDACQPAWTVPAADSLAGIIAYECGPGLGHRQTGEPCVANDDCASGTCDGAPLQVCFDGRQCATADDCPFDDNLNQTPCIAVGVQGGSCH